MNFFLEGLNTKIKLSVWPKQLIKYINYLKIIYSTNGFYEVCLHYLCKCIINKFIHKSYTMTFKVASKFTMFQSVPNYLVSEQINQLKKLFIQ